VDGETEFRNVSFSYPTRPTHTVLKDLSLLIKPGQFVALVGASGCGKSTVVSLLERFYSPSKGSMFIDGRDILSLDADVYRTSITMANQDVCLFQGTIREKILLGTATDRIPSEKETFDACREANIYDLIMLLP